MELQTIMVKTRESSGKEKAKKTRFEGLVPAVVYGGDGDPISVSLDRHTFELMIRNSRGGEHAIVKLEVEDKPELNTAALIKAIQHHPLRGQIVHADFMRINLDEKITTLVQVRLKGQAVGVVEGGVIDHQMREVEVECLALEVPEEIIVDVTNLHVGEGVHVGQLVVPENVVIITDPDRPVVAIHAPRAMREEAAEGVVAEPGAGEPEVITEKKEKSEKEK